MASITIDTAKSNGKYLRLTVTESSYSTRNNTSVVTWTLQSLSDYSEQEVNHSVSAVTVTINGTQVYYKGYTAASSNAFPAKNGSVSGTLTVSHNSNGAKTITCKLEGEVDSWVPTSRTKDLKLTTLDRSAPTVSFSIGSYTDNKVTFTANVSASCDLWQYSLNDGTWTTFYSTNTSTAQTYTITGLSANTEYTLKVRARKYSNYVYGTTSNVSFKTYGGSLINSVNTVTADASTVSIVFNATVYNSDVTHALELKNGSTTILTFSGISVVSGNNTITLSSSQRTTLLNAMSTIKSFTGTFVLRTYVGSTEIGSGTSRTATVQTTATNSSPTFSGFTYQDGNSTTVAVTGNNQILIQNKSSLMITASAATAKNGASISSYSVSAGSVSKSSTSTSINVGLIPNSGTVPVTVTAIDSRGYSKSVTVNVTVLAYNAVAFTQYTGRRENEIENTIQVAIQGALTVLTVSGVNKNTLVTLRYRYKETSSSNWSTWYNVTSAASVTSSGFTYNNNYLVSLDSEKSWHIEFNASDKLTGDTITLTIPQGVPLVGFRPKTVICYGDLVKHDSDKNIDISIVSAFESLVPYATEIPANAKLNSTEYVNIGRYFCASYSTVITLTDCPTGGEGFVMNVRNITSDYTDTVSRTWMYLVREIVTLGGNRYIQYCQSGSSVSWTFSNWKRIVTNGEVLGSGRNLNDYDYSRAGIYELQSGMSNAPLNWGCLIVGGYAGSHQLAFNYSSGIFIRSKTGSPLAWTRWRQVVTDIVEKATYSNTSVKQGECVCRRQGNVICISAENDAVSVPANTFTDWVTIGERFRPNEIKRVPLGNNSGTTRWAVINTNGKVQLFSSTAITSATNFAFEATYIVD